MSLIGIHHLAKSFGTQVLFEDLSFTIQQGDRIGLLGPNGAGKSTLLKILMNMESPDKGSVSKRQGLRVSYAGQFPHFTSASLEDVLMAELPQGDEIETRTRAQILLSKMQFENSLQDASKLSGGWKKRLDIARALMHEPQIVLLDEPTNHLDLEGILWLEKFLNRERFSYVVISHDRYFLENVTNKIIELNKCYPDGLFISEGTMSTYMERKELFLEGQAQMQRGLASVVRDEVDWLRRSPKARTTKSRSRIDKAYELMEELSEIKQRNKQIKVNLEFSASERETRKLIVAKNLSKTLGNKPLFKSIDLTLSPGDRLGIVGKNGTGKTTLLKMLAGSVEPDTGTIKYADSLKVVYFDQHREQLAPNISLRRALSPNSDTVNYRGQNIHVNGWAKKFLFTPDRMELPVGCLSGGERARILIARLMLEPADVLFLDEPTNDLDIQTLEVIEESLLEFNGAVVLISHDRCLMDRVCNKILGLGVDKEQEFFADYSQWETAAALDSEKKKETATPVKPEVQGQSKTKTKKLSFNEQRELDGMEEAILNAENELENFQEQLNEPDAHADASKSLVLYEKLNQAQAKLDRLYQRWEELELKAKST